MIDRMGVIATTDWLPVATVMAAIITAAGVLLGTLLSVKKEAKATNAKLATNHGKQPWEYLEMVGEIHNDQKELAAALQEHTEQDAQNFAELRASQKLLHSLVSSGQELVQEQRSEDLANG